jgi:ferrochelatase
MRYGNPSIAEGLESLRAAGCTQISVISLYPQYSASTTASVNDEVFRCLLKMRWQPALRTAGPWHDHPSYIDALAKSVKKHISKLGWKPDYLVASFHGLPVAYFEKGDPYHCHCAKTARLLKEKLGMKDDNFKLTFQSRFGPTKWLEPYTEATLRELGEAGHKNIAVITPGFISDCVETLEEIAIEARETFIDAGGENFTTIPCLNSSPESIKLLAQLAHAELAGWVA